MEYPRNQSANKEIDWVMPKRKRLVNINAAQTNAKPWAKTTACERIPINKPAKRSSHETAKIVCPDGNE